MGFDIKRFNESDIRQEFLCPICCDILQEPVILQECEHVFCGQCIGQWFTNCTAAEATADNNNKTCPIDRQVVDQQSLRPPQRSFKTLISSLAIQCDFADNGCRERVPIDELPGHRSQCAYNPEAMDQQIDCPLNCGAVVSRRCSYTNEHNCVSHLKNILEMSTKQINELKHRNHELVAERRQLTEQIDDLRRDNCQLSGKYEEVVKLLDQLLCTENDKLSTDRQQQSSDTIKASIISYQFNNNSHKHNTNANNINNDLISNSFNTLSITADMNDLIQFINDIKIETSVDNRQLVHTLKTRYSLTNERVIRSMLTIDRGLFAPSASSYTLHHVRGIGHGAHTGPATYDMALLQYLDRYLHGHSGCKVLDIGSGSGYLTCCIGSMLEPLTGRVVGIEHIHQLVQSANETIDRYYGWLKETRVVNIYLGDGRFGYLPEAPYDLIFLEPLTRRVPQRLIDQLKIGGHLMVPIGAPDKDINLELLTKQADGDVVRQVVCDDWKLMQPNNVDILEDRKAQIRSGWIHKLGF
ncbi:uncharacterized protein LOC128957112 [Oppia nitens]|uniref:uncharacterized protein LOC128957112 n=1 Tax=Oppia nitens TaxID=1686743 RepID=UPI0023DA314E|nr:uncharacterized protein LOC128957112 [Oppia nitens]